MSEIEIFESCAHYGRNLWPLNSYRWSEFAICCPGPVGNLPESARSRTPCTQSAPGSRAFAAIDRARLMAVASKILGMVALRAVHQTHETTTREIHF